MTPPPKPPTSGGARPPKPRRPSSPSPQEPPSQPAGRCPHERAVVDALTDAGMACRCLACGREFLEPWRGRPPVASNTEHG